jgi:hypothetical protein
LQQIFLPCLVSLIIDSDEELAQGSEKPNPVTPTELQCNAEASHDNPDAKNSGCQSDSNEPLPKKKKMLV